MQGMIIDYMPGVTTTTKSGETKTKLYRLVAILDRPDHPFAYTVIYASSPKSSFYHSKETVTELHAHNDQGIASMKFKQGIHVYKFSENGPIKLDIY